MGNNFTLTLLKADETRCIMEKCQTSAIPKTFKSQKLVFVMLNQYAGKLPVLELSTREILLELDKEEDNMLR
jgi:hypothetical protein